MNKIDLSTIQARPQAVALVSKKEPSESIWSRQIRLRSAFGLGKRKDFFDLLSILLQAGLGIMDAIEVVTEQHKTSELKQIGNTLMNDLRDGKPLSEAMSNQPKIFTTFEIHSIRMGESIGKISNVLSELAKYYESRLRIRRKLTQVLSYPIAVILIAGIVVGFMVTQVVPMFEEVFTQFDAELPMITQKVLGISVFFRQWGFLLLAIGLGLTILTLRIRKTESFRRISGQMLLRVPMIGQLLLKIHLARLSITLGSLLKSKVKLDEALRLAEEIVTYYPLQRTLPLIRKQIIEGGTFYQAVLTFEIYPLVFKQMTKVGEQTASLDQMFERLGTTLEQESETAIGTLTSLLEPLLILILAIIVGGILVSMYLPMFQLSQTIG